MVDSIKVWNLLDNCYVQFEVSNIVEIIHIGPKCVDDERGLAFKWHKIMFVDKEEYTYLTWVTHEQIENFWDKVVYLLSQELRDHLGDDLKKPTIDPSWNTCWQPDGLDELPFYLENDNGWEQPDNQTIPEKK